MKLLKKLDRKKIKKFWHYLITLRYVKLASYNTSKWLQRKIHNEYIKAIDKLNDKIIKLENRIIKLKEKIQLLSKDVENEKYLKHDYKYVFYYGFQIIYGAINKFLLLIIAGLIFHALPQILIVCVSFMLLRVWIGGLHYDSYTKCAWMSLLCLVSMGLASKYIPYNNIVNILVFITVFLIALKYAPIEHKNRPLTDEKKVKFKYIALIMVIMIYSIQTILCINGININNSIMYGILLSGIIALPTVNSVNKCR